MTSAVDKITIFAERLASSRHAAAAIRSSVFSYFTEHADPPYDKEHFTTLVDACVAPLSSWYLDHYELKALRVAMTEELLRNNPHRVLMLTFADLLPPILLWYASLEIDAHAHVAETAIVAEEGADSTMRVVWLPKPAGNT